MGAIFNPFTGTLDFTGTGGGGGGTPASPDTSVQFNDGGSFGGDVGLTYDKVTQKLVVHDSTGEFASLTVGDQASNPEANNAQIQLNALNPSIHYTYGLTLIASNDAQDNGGQIGTYIANYAKAPDASSFVEGALDIEQQSLAGDADEEYGLRIKLFALGALQTFARFKAIKIETPNYGTATVTDGYAIFINNQAGAANNYAIKTGTGLVAFGDEVDMATGKGIKLSTTDPHVAGVLWNNSGLAVISSG